MAATQGGHHAAEDHEQGSCWPRIGDVGKAFDQFANHDRNDDGWQHSDPDRMSPPGDEPDGTDGDVDHKGQHDQQAGNAADEDQLQWHAVAVSCRKGGFRLSVGTIHRVKQRCAG